MTHSSVGRQPMSPHPRPYSSPAGNSIRFKDYGLRFTVYGLRITDFGFRVADCGFRCVFCGSEWVGQNHTEKKRKSNYKSAQNRGYRIWLQYVNDGGARVDEGMKGSPPIQGIGAHFRSTDYTTQQMAVG